MVSNDLARCVHGHHEVVGSGAHLASLSGTMGPSIARWEAIEDASPERSGRV